MVNPRGEAALTLASATSKPGLDRKAQAALLRVRTGPESPEGNLRELTRDSNLDWDSCPEKSPNLRHQQPRSQNKGLSRASWLWTGPSPTRDRQARAARAKGGNCGPREASYTKLQADFIANQDFLGFWTVNIRREGHSQRSASQNREGTPIVHPENRAAGTGEGISHGLQLGATICTKDLLT